MAKVEKSYDLSDNHTIFRSEEKKRRYIVVRFLRKSSLYRGSKGVTIQLQLNQE